MKKSKEKALDTVITANDLRERISTVKTAVSPEYVLTKAGEAFSRLQSSGFDQNDSENQNLANQGMAVLSLDTHFLLTQAIWDKHCSFAIEFCNQLITEYACQSASEKALVHQVVGAYTRSLQSAELLKNAQMNATNDRVGLCSTLGKEIDRANRQFTSALTMLRHLKAPSMTVNVKTKAAFIAHNQQINAEKPEGKNEIN